MFKFNMGGATFGLAACLALPAFADSTVYIPMGSDNAVLSIDTTSDAITARVGDIPNVHGLGITPDGRRMVAGSFDEREAGEAMPDRPAAISEDEHQAHHSMSTGGVGAPSADGMLSTVSIIDAQTQQVIRRIDVPGAVHHVSINPRGDLAGVTQPNQGTVTLIDLNDYRVIATIATGPLPNYAVFDESGNRLFVSNAGNDTVSEIDVRDRFVNRNIRVGSSPEHVVLSPDGRSLFVNNIDDGTVSLVDIDAWQVRDTFDIGGILHGIDISEDGGTVYVASRSDDKVVAIDLANMTRRTLGLAPSPYHLAVVRGAGKIYVSSAEEPIVWVVDPESMTLQGEIAVGGKGHQIVQSMNAAE